MMIVAMGIHKEFATVRRTGRGHRLGIVWVGYTLETNVRTTDHDKSSTASYKTYGAWFGVPYAIIDRESFGDPVSSIMDVSLFHPLLLY